MCFEVLAIDFQPAFLFAIPVPLQYTHLWVTLIWIFPYHIKETFVLTGYLGKVVNSHTHVWLIVLRLCSSPYTAHLCAKNCTINDRPDLHFFSLSYPLSLSTDLLIKCKQTILVNITTNVESCLSSVISWWILRKVVCEQIK